MRSVQKIIHRSDSRGLADHGWLKSRHTFSFADYYNPERMGFGALRVINDDSVAPSMGFPSHAHRDMEIISVPLEGSLRHKDTEGNEHIVRKGEVQIMTAGSGIAHSEYNGSDSDPVNFLQIWVLPKKLRVPPRYAQKAFPREDRQNRFQLVVSPDARNGSIAINQEAFFSLADLLPAKPLTYRRMREGNGLYLFVIDGTVEAQGEVLAKRDALAILDAEEVTLRSDGRAEVLMMDVPMAPPKD